MPGLLTNSAALAMGAPVRVSFISFVCKASRMGQRFVCQLLLSNPAHRPSFLEEERFVDVFVV